MPFKSNGIRLNESQDRRRKLTTEQREEIERLYGTGCFSMKNLAERFKVSKKTVLLIVNKDSDKKAKQYRKEHWKEWQRTGDEWNKTIREHRRYKQRLYKEGKLQDNDSSNAK